MANEWHVIPENLQRARLAQLMTQEDLARKSGVSPRTIRSYEKKLQPARLDAPMPRQGARRRSIEGRAPAERGQRRGPRALVRAPAAYALHDGRRFYLSGVVDTQRGIPASEAKLLGSKPGVAARFHLLQRLVDDHVIGVTVHAATEAHTIELQALHKKEASVVARVFVLPGEPSDDVGFSSFITKVTAKRPWTFVVDAIVP